MLARWLADCARRRWPVVIGIYVTWRHTTSDAWRHVTSHACASTDWPRHVFPARRERIRAHLSRISGRFIEHAQTNSCGVTERRLAVACWHSLLQPILLL